MFEELDEECRPFILPPEKVLEHIERMHHFVIERTSFASRNYYNPRHKKGKHTPVFQYSSGQPEGKRVPIVHIDGLRYVVGHIMEKKVGKEPIPFHHDNAGRKVKNER